MMRSKALRAAFTLAVIVGLSVACAPQAAPAPAPAPAEATAVPTEVPAEPTAAPAEPTVAPTEAPPEATAVPEAAAMEGEVVVSLQGQDTQTWQALCDAYVAKNPKAKCSVELKPSEGYQDWIRAQFAGGEPRAIVGERQRGARPDDRQEVRQPRRLHGQGQPVQRGQALAR